MKVFEEYTRFSRDPPLDWASMDTSRAKEFDDKRLLILISGLSLEGFAGFGLVAELCKRYAESRGLYREAGNGELEK